jgi:hypothetical protein|tara:strand:- start:1613 stop:1855 length:243 start_codon:yes stop_codon:yes gene_type:complete
MKKVEKQELENLQELNSNFIKLKTQLGDLELQKQLILEQVSIIKNKFAQTEKELIEKYGDSAVINLQSGEITEKEPEKEK